MKTCERYFNDDINGNYKVEKDDFIELVRLLIEVNETARNSRASSNLEKPIEMIIESIEIKTSSASMVLCLPSSLVGDALSYMEEMAQESPDSSMRFVGVL